MQNKYPDLYSLLESDGEARQYFDTLPEYLKASATQWTSIRAATTELEKAISHETVFCNI